MANMSYCQFRNTLRDLNDCKHDIHERVDNAEEDLARLRLLKLCKTLADDYIGDLDTEIEAARKRYREEG